MMISELDVQNLSKPEKIWLLEAVWRNLTCDDSGVPSPAWHESDLRHAEYLVAKGDAHFSEWKVAKDRINKVVSDL
jgi:hypothetical protein